MHYCTRDTEFSDLAETSPLQLLLAGGIHPRAAESGDYDYQVQCPGCRGTLDLMGELLVCRDRGKCAFGTGRIVDLLAGRAGGSYEAVKALLERARPEWRHLPSWVHLPDYLRKSHLARWLRGVALQPPPTKGAEALLLGAARRQSYHKLVEFGRLQVLGVDLLQRMKKHGFGVSDNAPKLGIPMWTHQGEFNGWVFVEADHLAHFQIADAPLTIAWGRHGFDRLQLDFQLGVFNQELSLRDSRDAPLPAMARRCGTIDTPISIEIPTPAAFPEFGKLHRICRQLDVAGMAADEWLLSKILSEVTDEVPRSCRQLLAAVDLSATMQFRIENELRKRGNERGAAALRTHFMCREVFRKGRDRVLATHEGYVHRDGVSSDSRIANFLLLLKDNLVFPDSSDVFHAGTLLIDGNELSFQVPASDLASAAKLESALRSQVSNLAMPTVMDPTKMNRWILPFFRQDVAELPRKIGVASLGWTASRDRFQGAGWMVSMDAIERKDMVLRPDIQTFKSFSAEAQPEGLPATDVPPAGRDLLAMLAAMLCRSFVRGRCRGVLLQNSHSARELTARVFRALGQHTAFEMSANLRHHSSIAGLQGYPLLAAGYNTMQASNCNQPIIFLTDTGYHVAEDDYNGMTAVARWTLQRVVEWLIRTKGEEFSEQRSFHHQVSLLQEGAATVAAACRLEAWEVSPPLLPSFERLIGAYAATDLGQLMTAKGDQILFSTDSAGDIHAELLAAGVSVARDGSTLSLPSLQLVPMLADYYGQIPLFTVTGPGESSAALESAPR